MNNTPSQISLSYFMPKTIVGQLANLVTPLLDRLFGIKKLQKLYLKHDFAGLEKQAFTLKLLKVLGVTVEGEDALINKIPKTGRFIVVCNHPYGMIEGVIIARLLTAIRPDTKVMANIGLTLLRKFKTILFLLILSILSLPLINRQLRLVFNIYKMMVY
ncbi:hypothetical protein ACLKMH_23045 [Psychromonas sp. KJ10-10]|uniref:hypothetical protein n=1 Tax=Psychromonas sp. KJ10-10 TaxID=3391823 RepID=UPI0039B45E89